MLKLNNLERNSILLNDGKYKIHLREMAFYGEKSSLNAMSVLRCSLPVPFFNRYITLNLFGFFS